MQEKLLTSAEIEALRDRAVEAEKRLAWYESEMEELRNRVICCRKDQDKLQAKGKSHVAKWASLAEDSGLTINRRRAVTRLWGEYKQTFGGLRSYRDTPEFRFEEGMQWIDAWSLPDYLIDFPRKELEHGSHHPPSTP